MAPALQLLLASTAVGGWLLVTDVQLAGIYNTAIERAAVVQELHDAQTLEAARLMHQLSKGGDGRATPEQLVEAGYLKPEFLTREKVDRAPLATD